MLFGFLDDLDHTLNDYGRGKVPIRDTAHDVTTGGLLARGSSDGSSGPWIHAVHRGIPGSSASTEPSRTE